MRRLRNKTNNQGRSPVSTSTILGGAVDNIDCLVKSRNIKGHEVTYG